MGIYLNPDNIGFQEAINSEIYVDKTDLIQYTNNKIRTSQKYICVSRPRRFGKSMTANMLTAYYSRGCDSKEMFGKYKIAENKTFENHLNKYNVIHINVVDFIEEASCMSDMINEIKKSILYELTNAFSDVEFYDKTKLTRTLNDVFNKHGIPFIFVIDEWDCIFRKHKNDYVSQTEYLNFLKVLLIDQNYLALAYMTGILPIKKYGEHSAINMFTKISMTDPREFAKFTGFTENEVKTLCEKYNMSFEETRQWYNGYNLMGISIYNPRSVVMSMTGGYFNNYWTSTETYEALKVYIMLNFDGLRDKIVRLIAGERIYINIGKFQNDMTSLNSADDVLTLLVHLGYLTYDFDEKTAWIPNSEVQQEFINSIEDGGWEEIMSSITQSEKLLKATINCEEEKVAKMVEESHRNNVFILQYNDENSLSCVISLAYYSARKNYSIYREMPGGEGYADIVFIPRNNCSDPAMIVELKCQETVESAIKQIKDRKYYECLKNYTGEILLVAISYDKTSKVDKKHHTCKIEKIYKNEN